MQGLTHSRTKSVAPHQQARLERCLGAADIGHNLQVESC